MILDNVAGLTLERAVLIAAPMKASALGFGKQRSGVLIVGILVAVVLAFHLPTLFFLQYDQVKVIRKEQNVFRVGTTLAR